MPPDTLHFITLSVCLFTLTLATAALMPQLKRALTLIRDAMLGAILVIGLSFAGFLVWGRVFNGNFTKPVSAGTADPRETRVLGDIFAPEVKSDEETPDPLPLPSIEDETAENWNRFPHQAVVSNLPSPATRATPRP